MADAPEDLGSPTGGGDGQQAPDTPVTPGPHLATPGSFGNIRLSNAQQEGLFNLFTGYDLQYPVPRGEALLQQIREDLEPRELVHPEITVNYEMYKKIRVFLNNHGVDTPSTGASGGLIVNRIIYTIWNRPQDIEERKKALEQFRSIKRGEFVLPSPSVRSPSPLGSPFLMMPHNPAPGPVQPTQGQGTHGNQRAWENSNAAKGMSVAYSSDKQKLWGKSDEDWLTKLSRYQFMCNQNKVTGTDKISYLHYMLDGAALQFFINDIEGNIHNWGEVIRRFHDRYASAAKQDYISHRMAEMHISNFEVGEDATEGKALRKTIDELDRLAPMSHPEDRTDRAKMLHLQQAVLGREWARTVLSNVTANELKCHTLIERLEYALQQSLKHKAASHGEAGGTNQLRTSRWKPTNFAGQGRYGNEPSSRRSIVPKYPNSLGTPRGPRPRTYPRERWQRNTTSRGPLLCHNCNKPGCRWYKCSEPLDMQRVAQNKLKYARGDCNTSAPSKVHIANMASDLAQDIMETMLVSNDTDDENIEEADAQEELMARLEEGAAQEASINHSVSFDLDDQSDGSHDLDGDLDRSVDFYNGA